MAAQAAAAAAGSRNTVPRLALNRAEAALALGVSIDFFDDHVALELRCIRRGRRRLYPLSELRRWLEEAAERPPTDGRAL
jgi:hypothetical protein